MNFKINKIGKNKKISKKVRILKIMLIILLVSVAVFISFVVYVLAQVSNVIDSRYSTVSEIDGGTINIEEEKECGIFGCVSDMIFNRSCALKQTAGRSNILVLGAGGKEHIQGGDILTDTIIVISLDHDKGDVSMISVPRDLWVKSSNYPSAKINTLYRSSDAQFGEGFKMPKEVIEELLDMPIHYYAFIDFVAFKEVIDALSGVDVYVDNSFTDTKYPDGHFGYMEVSFEKGPTTMDGETALEYARSRHGNNGESSDFARARRQQKIIQAIKDKVLSFGTLFRIDNIASAISNNYRSNIKPCEIYSFLMAAKDISKDKIYTTVLDDGPSGLLYTPTVEMREEYYGGQYVLVPDGNNYDIIKKYVSKFLTNPQAFSSGPTVSVLNGTNIPGLANKVGAELAAEGYRIVLRDNTYNRNSYKNTVIYTDRPGDFYKSLLFLERYSGGKPIGERTEPLKYDSDIVLILGQDFKGIGGISSN